MEYRPLSSAQKLFFGNIHIFQNSMWNIGYYIQFNQKYSYEKICFALNEFLKKNDGVRLRITVLNNVPYSYIAEYEENDFEEKTFHAKEELNNFANETVNRPFLIDSNLYRCFICDIKNTSGILFVAHHMLCDGGSIASLDSVIKFLADGCEMQSFSYIPHLEKDLDYCGTAKCNRDKEYWKEVFQCSPKCNLYTENDFLLNYNSQKYWFNISPEVSAYIRRYCVQNHISVQAFFDTVFGLYFRNQIGAIPFSIGIPLSNRISINDIKTFGLYIQVVPLIINFKSLSFADNAKYIDDTLLSMYRHFHYASYDISQDLLNGHKAYDVSIEYHPEYKTEICEMKTFYSNKLATALEIHIEDSDNDGINILCRYREQFFNEKNILSMVEQIRQIIDNVIYKNNISDSEFLLKNKKTSDSVLKGNDVSVPNGNIFDLFAVNAKKHSEKICIRDGNSELTYREFFSYVSNLIRRIKQAGFSGNDKIIIISERSVEMYVAIYAAVGAGGCFVPVDPQCPKERLEYIVKDSSARIVLVQNDKLLNIDESNNIKIIFVDQCLKDSVNSDETVISPAKSEDLAYLIYTSGTTGVPKGVMITHGSLINRLQWMNNKYGLEGGNVILQKTPYTFDVSVWEIFWWGAYGGSMYILPPKDHYSMSKTVKAISDGKVTHIHFVPSVYNIFVNYLKSNLSELSKLTSLKHVFLSGEALDKNCVAEMDRLLCGIEQHNLYGPTECTIDVTFYDYVKSDSEIIPIGKPIDNTQIYIVDENMNLTPQGQKGELCIGGANVGEGYLNLSELSMKKFVDNPFGEGRLFLSGDVAYINDEFQIIYCGRKDEQIKLFGQRIELIEIENTLRQLEFVEEAAVIVDTNKSTPKIKAFYTGTQNENGITLEYLKSKLPRYMIPSSVHHIDSMPITSHGKTDKKELIKLSNDLEEKAFTEPKNMLEGALCKLFSEQLKRDSFSSEESFLDAGATSLDVVSVLCSELLDNISIDEFCLHPSPSALAKYLLGNKPVTNELVPLSISKSEKRVVVLFPYAGGGVLSFGTLLKKLKENLRDTSYYFFGWDTDIKRASKEIAQLMKNSKTVFYAHCAGVSLAINVMNEIDRITDNKAQITFFAGGIILPNRKFPIINPWRFVPDMILKNILVKAGLKKELVDSSAFNKVMRQFKNNAQKYFDFIQAYKGKIKHPTTVFLARGDVFTKKINDARKMWAMYVQNELNVEIIEGDSHYFLADSNSLLFHVIINNLSKGEDQA